MKQLHSFKRHKTTLLRLGQVVTYNCAVLPALKAGWLIRHVSLNGLKAWQTGRQIDRQTDRHSLSLSLSLPPFGYCRCHGCPRHWLLAQKAQPAVDSRRQPYLQLCTAFASCKLELLQVATNNKKKTVRKRKEQHKRNKKQYSQLCKS